MGSLTIKKLFCSGVCVCLRYIGVDLYCELGTRVIACEDGVVVSVCWFTGKNVLTDDGTPAAWWNDTMAVMIEGLSGVVVYGEVASGTVCVSVGDSVVAGTVIGAIDVPVLTSFKGRSVGQCCLLAWL